MRLPVSPVQRQEGMGKRGRVGRGQPQIGQRRRGICEHRIGQSLSHVGDHAFGIAGRKFGDIQPEFARQPQHHGG